MGTGGQGGADSYPFPWIYLGAGQHQGGKGPSPRFEPQRPPPGW